MHIAKVQNLYIQCLLYVLMNKTSENNTNQKTMYELKFALSAIDPDTIVVQVAANVN